MQIYICMHGFLGSSKHRFQFKSLNYTQKVKYTNYDYLFLLKMPFKIFFKNYTVSRVNVEWECAEHSSVDVRIWLEMAVIWLDDILTWQGFLSQYFCLETCSFELVGDSNN